MNSRKKLFSSKVLYGNNSALFVGAVQENCSYHYNHCPEYKKILDAKGFSPETILKEEDIGKIPFLPTVFLKSHRIFSMPRNRMLIKATSSGTNGRFSEIGFEFSGLLCGLKMVLKTGFARNLFSMMPCRYVVLGYKPHKSNRAAAVKTAFGATFFAPAISRTYALKHTKNGYKSDLEGVMEAIKKASGSNFPLRLVGFPSYAYFVLKRMEEENIVAPLKKGSKIMLGGGWKEFYTQQVDKETLYDLAKKVLDIEAGDIIEFFSAVEHPILYCDCKNHHFHVPVYSRVIIRDVDTLLPLPKGEIGLVNFISPMLCATPVLSIMTDDLGVLRQGSQCGCGIEAPYFEILGRVGLSEVKTCAAGANEVMKEAGV